VADTTHTEAVMALFAAHIAEIAARFDRALESSGFDSVIVYSGDEITRDRDDIVYPYAAEPYFEAWAPLQNAPGSAVTYTPGERPRLVHFEDTSFWHEPPSSPSGEWVEQFELRCAHTTAERDASLAIGRGRCAAIGPPDTKWLGSVVPNDPTLLTALDYDRAWKTPYEAACIARANEIAARGHATAQRLFREDASEFAINHAYCESTQQRETELPYGNIVAFNEHAAVLHYQNLRNDPPGTPSSFLLDAGARFNGYASDITRTIARESEMMSDLIAAVDSLQRRVYSEIRAGADWVDLNERTHVLVAEVLEDHDIVTCSAADAYERGITRYFLPHGLGHLLGLQVHDVGGRLVDASGTLRAPPDAHPMLRLTRVLEHGFVVTVEPGIYFVPSLLDELRGGEMRDMISWGTVESLTPFGGVRIEDDVLVTNDGCINLSRPALESVGVW
jgi:Xaa-Pro dipeptidase